MIARWKRISLLLSVLFGRKKYLLYIPGKDGNRTVIDNKMEDKYLLITKDFETGTYILNEDYARTINKDKTITSYYLTK